PGCCRECRARAWVGRVRCYARRIGGRKPPDAHGFGGSGLFTFRLDCLFIVSYQRGVAATVASIRPRRTQEERSTTTGTQPLDAALASLADLGYARTTTTEVARRAGLSRGAQLHHYPTKEELVVAALEHLLDRRHQEFLDAFAALPPDANRLDAAIDL